jgi:hypothetical protein
MHSARELTLPGIVGTAAAVLAAVLTAVGCSTFGWTDRVLLRVPSPDSQMVAVCQEVPQFDGPGFVVRLERPDGTVLRRLYEIGDADGCSEIAWAADGQTLAVLTGHVARLRFIDVAWVLDHPTVETAYWSWRQVSLAGEGQFLLGKGLRFTSRMEVELQLCPYSLDAVRRTGMPACNAPSVTRRLSIPQPIVTGHQVRTAGG